eukprot:CAMPEP_0114579128 /NCGR_PEP_ID=MMETSP0125-20121206/3568_1 /TAXON_ID=485358 ORGANISM="Aristerostoma sp., Strain ATCC 50986" /NCGR_SAMPLE_ID=MMETSP0125 /ASSEMBLY_ACC=CAM_ASM_000245 /LENGTH=86 /DNA_ID=CAMNT_0001769689 /DNA_START=2120 /DNA_END=2380 /DNA_ORIENTATION=+
MAPQMFSASKQMAPSPTYEAKDLVQVEKKKKIKTKNNEKDEKKRMDVAPSLPKQKPKPKGNKNSLTEVVKKQNLSGSWEADSSVAS